MHSVLSQTHGLQSGTLESDWGISEGHSIMNRHRALGYASKSCSFMRVVMPGDSTRIGSKSLGRITGS